jgi:hypothetical protein
MKKVLLMLCMGTLLFSSCNSKKDEKVADATTDKAKTEAAPADLPYTAMYTSSWSQEVSDADLKMVLMTYKNWQDGKIDDLMAAMGDSVMIDMASGKHLNTTRADLGKMWTSYRDSLSGIKINMQSWNKMYATDKKESYVVTWYDEYDTYKDGHVDSATFHDINQIKNGKISWYATYKRPLKQP